MRKPGRKARARLSLLAAMSVGGGEVALGAAGWAMAPMQRAFGSKHGLVFFGRINTKYVTFSV